MNTTKLDESRELNRKSRCIGSLICRITWDWGRATYLNHVWIGNKARRLQKLGRLEGGNESGLRVT